MKKIINGKVYNTQTAKCVGEMSWGNMSDFAYCNEELYRKSTGEYFLFGEGGGMSKYAKSSGQNSWGWGDAIIPMTIEEAKVWAEENLDGDEYEKIFGVVEEPDTTTRINWTLDIDIVEDLRQRTADTGIPASRAVSDVLRTAGYGKK